MFRNFFLIIFFSTLFFPAVGQTYKRKIDWLKSSKEFETKKDDSKKSSHAEGVFVHFEQARYPDSETMVPYYFELIPINPGVYSNEQVEVSVINRVYEPMASDNTILDLSKIESEPDVTFEVGISRKKSFLTVICSYFVLQKEFPQWVPR